eukprot:CAMPEP_0119335562 /NCGR_PEP_ID=MMETSP1333-20130426/89814_1 /TAXON_ID=418940 /ORGANISM="Scyphosphaera apsteinii, Strain RCC1455" /LENGTH=248 /DNA_ID=CAMNT_0007346139 /DNA_START=37 /DNA_END=783 /DNA_ORIENTATION=+
MAPVAKDKKGKEVDVRTIGEILVATGGGNGGLRNPDGTWHGTGAYPTWTMKYFDFKFKGHDKGVVPNSAYYTNPLLFEHILNNEPSLTCLDVEGRGLKDDQMIPIVKALKNNTTITELKLGRNDFDHACLDLMEILKTNNTITKVDIHNNDIHAKGICAIAEMLSCNSTITDLNMSCTFVRDEAKYIGEALGMNTTLKVLNMDNCQITDVGAAALVPCLKESSVKDFRGYNNCVEGKELRKQLKKGGK